MVKLNVSSSYKVGLTDIPWNSWDVSDVVRQSKTVGFDFTNGAKMRFGGSGFHYDDGGALTSGSVKSFSLTVGGKTAVSIEGIKLSADQFLDALNEGLSVENLLQYSLNGKDSFKGGAGGDQLLTYAGDDTIDGRGGSDLIIGGTGRDKLTGGAGNDTFVFNTAFKSSNVDEITDFSNKHGNNDVFELDSEYFVGTTGSHLPKGMFKTVTDIKSTKGLDRDDHILYDKKHGDLYYDRDGSGGKYHAEKFAHLDNHASLSAADFVVI